MHRRTPPRTRTAALALLAALALGPVASLVPARPAAARSPLAAASLAEAVGVRVPTGLTGQRAYDGWIGRSLDHTLLYAFEPEHLVAVTKDGAQASGRAQDGTHTAVITLGLVPKQLDDPLKTGTNVHHDNIRRGLAGEFDAIYTTMARRLVERGLHQPWPDGRPKVVIRLGHEHNLLHTEWHSGGIEADWARLFRRMVGKMESVTGPQLLFEWNSSFTGAPAKLQAAYPGDDVVDVIGVDFYDRFGYPSQSAFPAASGASARTPAQREASWTVVRDGKGDATTGMAGLGWFSEFARSHGKVLGISEWGLHAKDAGGSWVGGGDNPYFIEQVHAFFDSVARAGHLGYALYFEANPLKEGSATETNTFHKMTPGSAGEPVTASPGATEGSRFPAAAKRYHQLFGGAGTTAAPAPAPSPTPTTAPPQTTTTTAPTTATTAAPTTTTTAPQTTTTTAPQAPTTTAPPTEGDRPGKSPKAERSASASTEAGTASATVELTMTRSPAPGIAGSVGVPGAALPVGAAPAPGPLGDGRTGLATVALALLVAVSAAAAGVQRRLVVSDR